jgi:hypothetical protein
MRKPVAASAHFPEAASYLHKASAVRRRHLTLQALEAAP